MASELAAAKERAFAGEDAAKRAGTENAMLRGKLNQLEAAMLQAKVGDKSTGAWGRAGRALQGVRAAGARG